MKFKREILVEPQWQVLRKIGLVITHHNFYLGGGTAIALQLGHRRSVDFDWFIAGDFDPLSFAQKLREQIPSFVTEQISPGTLHGRLTGVRLTFLAYRYPLLEPLVPWPAAGCELASLDDLACMKLVAVAQRGTKKDFVDIHALGRGQFPLEKMLDLYKRKYDIQDVVHLLYALTYFNDADNEPLPQMLRAANWQTIKDDIEEWVAEIINPSFTTTNP